VKSQLITSKSKVVIAFVAACIAYGAGAAPEVLNGTSKQIWIASVQSVSKHVTIKSMDRETGLVVSDLTSIPGDFNSKELNDYVVAPKGIAGFLSTWNGLKVQMTANINEIDSAHSTIDLEARYIGYEDNMSHRWVDLRSNGNLERSIISEIRTKLAEAARLVTTP